MAQAFAAARLTRRAASDRAARRRKGIATPSACSPPSSKLTRSAYERRLLKLLRVRRASRARDATWSSPSRSVDVTGPTPRWPSKWMPSPPTVTRQRSRTTHVLDADFNAADIRILRFTGRRIANAPYAVVATDRCGLWSLRLGGLPATPASVGADDRGRHPTPAQNQADGGRPRHRSRHRAIPATAWCFTRGQQLAALDGGVIETGADTPLEQRLARIHARRLRR